MAQVNLHVHGLRGYQARVQQAGDGNGIMKGAALPAEDLFLGLAEMLHQVHEQSGGAVARLCHPLHDFRIAEDLPGHVQADHGNGAPGGEADMGGLRVGQDVKLRRRGDVSVGIGAAHQDDALYFFRNPGFHPQGHP